MNAQELADKFTAKIAVAAVEKDRQTEIAADNVEKRTADVEHCKTAMEQNVLPFLAARKLTDHSAAALAISVWTAATSRIADIT